MLKVGDKVRVTKEKLTQECIIGLQKYLIGSSFEGVVTNAENNAGLAREFIYNFPTVNVVCTSNLSCSILIVKVNLDALTLIQSVHTAEKITALNKELQKWKESHNSYSNMRDAVTHLRAAIRLGINSTLSTPSCDFCSEHPHCDNCPLSVNNNTECKDMNWLEIDKCLVEAQERADQILTRIRRTINRIKEQIKEAEE